MHKNYKSTISILIKYVRAQAARVHTVLTVRQRIKIGFHSNRIARSQSECLLIADVQDFLSQFFFSILC